jgi:hypothetical protein
MKPRLPKGDRSVLARPANAATNGLRSRLSSLSETPPSSMAWKAMPKGSRYDVTESVTSKVRFAARLGGVLVLAGPLFAACGASSSSTNPIPSGGAAASAGGAAAGASGGTTPSTAGGGNGNSAAGVGSVNAGEGGEPNGDAAGSGGDGGASMSSPDKPQLGGACQSPGALACAGAHQKLTLICSAGRKWEANQTCPSGQFCSSTPGPDLGICKAPDVDCAERQPGDAFCASDAITLLQCDADGIATAEVEKCQAGCVDGACALPRQCPENIVYSCDPTCPGPSTNPSCFEVCPTPAGGLSPLLELNAVATGIKYAIALPVVAPNSQPCSCAKANGALAGVVFRVPSPKNPNRWRFTYPKTWEFRRSPSPASAETNDYYKACMLAWPGQSSATPGCATIGPEIDPPLVWLSANAPVTEPGTVFVELLPFGESTCAL